MSVILAPITGLGSKHTKWDNIQLSINCCVTRIYFHSCAVFGIYYRRSDTISFTCSMVYNTSLRGVSSTILDVMIRTRIK